MSAGDQHERTPDAPAEAAPQAEAACAEEAPRRIGVYVCHCGGNISDVVDVEKVIDAAGKLPGVVVAKTGTTDNASALSGFVGDRYVFSILQNGWPLDWGWARVAQDRFATILATP